MSFEDRWKQHKTLIEEVEEEQKLKNSYNIVELQNPLIDQDEKQFLEQFLDELPPKLNLNAFLKFYNEDSLGKLIKNPETTLNDVYKILNSFK